MQPRNDAELIGAYADAGDEPAFAELVSRHQPMVYRACFRMLRDAHEAQDAVQAVFIVLYKKAGGLRRKGSLAGWLYTVARNVALESLRRRAARARRQEEIAMQQAHRTPQTDTPVDTERVLGVVDQELNGLSAVLRQAVILRYLEGYSEKDAAAIAGCPHGTLSRRASDGIARLRAKLARGGIVLGAATLAGLLESEATAAVPEMLLPSVLTAVRSAATTGVAAGEETAMMLAKGAMKIMFWNQVKVVAAVAAGIVVVAGGVPLAVHVAMAAEQDKNVDLKPAETEVYSFSKDEKWGFIDATGRVVVEPKFLNPDWQNNINRRFFAEGLQPVQVEKGKWGYINLAGELVIKPQFTEAGDFQDGRAVVCIGGETHWRRPGGKWGCIDRTGKFVIPAEFDAIGPFSEGLARACVQAKPYGSGPHVQGGKWGFIDKAGKWAVQPEYDWVSGFSEGLTAVGVGSPVLCGVVDARGQVVVKPQFGVVGTFHDGLASVIVEPMTVNSPDPYNWAGYNYGVMGSVFGAQRVGYIDKTGRVAIAPQFAEATDFTNGLADVKVPNANVPEKWRNAIGLWGRIAKTGTFIVKPLWNSRPAPGSVDPQAFVTGRQWTFSDTTARDSGGKWGYADAFGKTVIEPKFNLAYPFADGLAVVRLEADAPYGYIDATGKVVIEPRFDQAYPFGCGVAWASVDKKWGLIDRTGKFLLQPQLAWPGVDQFRPGKALVMVALSDVKEISRNENERIMEMERGYVDKTGKIVCRFAARMRQSLGVGGAPKGGD